MLFINIVTFMERKLIVNSDTDISFKKHPKIKGLQIINGKINFPISWLNQQGYCEYSLYLQYFKEVIVPPTEAMSQGSNVHEKLEENFKRDATPGSFKEVVEISKETATLSREVFVVSPEYGIRGFIDEIWMTPTEFVIIDDKPGSVPYYSTMNQVRAYCLAFKNMVDSLEGRKVIGALRERGTNNIFWKEEFDENSEKGIKFLIKRMEGLFEGTKPFIPTKNFNKCRKCRFQTYCKYFKLE